MANKNTFIMRDEWGPLINALPPELAGRVIQAVFAYRMTGEHTETDPALKAILTMILGKLDEDAAKYEETCKKNAENRAKRNDRTTTVNDRTTTVNDGTHDNEYEYDNDSDNESVSDSFKTSCGKRSKNRSPLEPEADTAVIPLSDGSAWRPPISLYETYEQSYPAVDLPQEFNKMRAWCLSNPKNCKTKNGVKRFVNSWLGKAQDRAAKQPTGRASPYQHSNSDVLLSIINGGA